MKKDAMKSARVELPASVWHAVERVAKRRNLSVQAAVRSAVGAAFIGEGLPGVRRDRGQKDDGGKLAWHLLSLDAVHEFVRVLQFGAYEKPRPDGSRGYGANNWELVDGARKRYYDAALRHLTEWYGGRERDPESGRHTLAHAMCCVAFLLALDLRGKLGPR
jgi:hypothetical protein